MKKHKKLIARLLLVIIFFIILLSKFSKEDMSKMIDSNPTLSYVIAIILVVAFSIAALCWFVVTLFRMRDGGK